MLIYPQNVGNKKMRKSILLISRLLLTEQLQIGVKLVFFVIESIPIHTPCNRIYRAVIKKMFFYGRISYNDEVCITSSRHMEALLEALDSMNQVEKSLEMDMPEDFYSIDLMSAYASLGRIIGEEVGDDLVNEIFSKFCMGK